MSAAVGHPAAGLPTGLRDGARTRPAGRGYSRFVGLMRWLLPTVALALAAIVVAWPQLSGTLGVGRISIGLGEPMTMTHPRYVGATDTARPYAVEADKAILDPADPDRIRLESMRADIGSAGGRDLRLVSRRGVYDRSRSVLDLDGGIEVASSDGFVFRSPRARVEIDAGRVEGPSPIEGEGPAGTIRADRFEFTHGGDLLRFDGRVKVTLQPTRDRSP